MKPHAHVAIKLLVNDCKTETSSSYSGQRCLQIFLKRAALSGIREISVYFWIKSRKFTYHIHIGTSMYAEFENSGNKLSLHCFPPKKWQPNLTFSLEKGQTVIAYFYSPEQYRHLDVTIDQYTCTCTLISSQESDHHHLASARCPTRTDHRHICVILQLNH